MKRNKLQEYADRSLSKYENKELQKQIVEESVLGSERVLNTKKTWLISIAAVFIILLLAFGTYLLWPKAPGQEKHYLLENQVTHDISITEFNAAVKEFVINDESVSSIKKIEDSKYNEVLYFTISYYNETTNEMMTIIMVTNLEYDYPFINDNYNKENETFNMNYVEQYTEEDGIFFFNCFGEFTVNGIEVYVQYEGLSLEPQSNFINFLQQCITIE